MTFNDLQLDGRLLRALETLKFSTPTDIQREAIPVVLAGRDLMASAQTGTGKTAAFMLPTLHKLLSNPASPGMGPRVLVLTPTRELAQQVTKAVTDFGSSTKLRMGAIVGGVPYFQQQRLLSKPVDILVATPGRLLDHLERGRIDFSRVETLILDEADRMLDMGFIDDIETIVGQTPAARQTLLFSATLEGEVERIAQTLLRDPARIQISGVKEKHESITQFSLAADGYDHKIKMLDHLLRDTAINQAVVFVGTKAGAEEVADLVKAQGHFASALHGDMRQTVRDKVIARAHTGRLRVLVATDVAARGLDVKGVTHVINFDLPMVPEDYVHRIGRTGRGGASGVALTMVNGRDWHKMERIERLTGQRLEEMVLEGCEPRTGRPQRRPRAEGSGSGGPRRGGRTHSGPRRGESRFGDSRQGESRFADAPRAPRGESRFGDNRHSESRFADAPRAPRGDRFADGDHASRERGDFARRPRRFDGPSAADFETRETFSRDSEQPRSYENRSPRPPRGDRPFGDRPQSGEGRRQLSRSTEGGRSRFNDDRGARRSARPVR